MIGLLKITTYMSPTRAIILYFGHENCKYVISLACVLGQHNIFLDAYHGGHHKTDYQQDCERGLSNFTRYNLYIIVYIAFF